MRLKQSVAAQINTKTTKKPAPKTHPADDSGFQVLDPFVVLVSLVVLVFPLNRLGLRP